MRSLLARRLDINDWLSTLTPTTLTHYAGMVVGLILMVRGGLGSIYYSDRYRSRKKIAARVQVGRLLYLVVGFFWLRLSFFISCLTLIGFISPLCVER